MIRAIFTLALSLPLLARATILPSDVILIEDKGGAIQSTASILPDPYLQKVACAVYTTEQDNYDVLFVFTTIPQNIFSQTPAAAIALQTQDGIGKPKVDFRSLYCSKRLKIAIRMSDIALLPDDPDGPYYMAFNKPFCSGVQVMAHEFGHYWMAYVAYDKGDGTGKHCRIRGFTGGTESGSGDCDGYPPSAFAVHWSAYFNSDSVMYGNQIKELGGGWFEIGNDGKLKYGPLDQYLMGLRLPEEVGPLFLLDMGPLTPESAAYPEPIGTSRKVQAKKIEITVEDIIRAEGSRNPALDPCHWKGALVLVYAQGSPPSQADLKKVAAYGNRFEAFYEWATDGRGSIDLTRDGRGIGTARCPAPGSQQFEDFSMAPETAAPDFAYLDPGPPPETIVLDVLPDQLTWQGEEILKGASDTTQAQDASSARVGGGCAAAGKSGPVLLALALFLALVSRFRSRVRALLVLCEKRTKG